MKIGYKQLILVGLVLVFLEISAFFTVNVPLPPNAHLVSAAGMILLAIPSFAAAIEWLGGRNGVVLISALSIFAFGIETAAILTGFPYGHFGYSEQLGYRILGYTPWTVPFGWVPLMLAAGAIALRLSENRLPRIVIITVTLLTFDLVLDPGAVLLGFWSYHGGGGFYGVPLSNFAGWLFSGAVGAIIFEVLIAYFKPLLPAPVQVTQSAGLTIFFWTGIAFFGGMFVPGVIGAAILVGISVFYLRSYYPYDDMVVLVDEENRPIATARKLEIHHSDTPLHRAFSIFLFNNRGELLLQQRALTKKTWPGAWSNSCCGHLMLDEKIENAAKRRVNDELGMTGIDPIVILPDFRYRAEEDGVVENEICPVMIGFTNTTPVINPDEVNDIKWVHWDDFLIQLAEPDSGFSPWAVEETALLAGNAKFKEHYFANNAQVTAESQPVIS